MRFIVEMKHKINNKFAVNQYKFKTINQVFLRSVLRREKKICYFIKIVEYHKYKYAKHNKYLYNFSVIIENITYY